MTGPGVSIDTGQQRPETLENIGDKDIKPAPAPLPPGLALPPEQQELVKQVFQAERAAARLWEYRFLNLFLARGTQVILDWFVSLGQATTVNAYDAYWITYVTDGTQRRIILEVLVAHHLVQQDGQTPYGEREGEGVRRVARCSAGFTP